MQSIRIALKNATRQKKRTVLLASAVGFGFLIVTLIIGFTGGLVESITDNFSNAFGGHIYLAGSEVSDRGSEIRRISDVDIAFGVKEELDKAGIRIQSISTRCTGTATLVFGSKEIRHRIDGIDFSLEEKLLGDLDVALGSLDSLQGKNILILPKGSAEELGVNPGEFLLVKSQTVYGQENLADFMVIATTNSSSEMGFPVAYTNIKDLNIFLGLGADEFQSYNIFLENLHQTDKAARIISDYIEDKGTLHIEEEDNENQMRSMMLRMMGGSLKSIEEKERWSGTKFNVTTIDEYTTEIMTMVDLLNMVGNVIFLIILAITMVGIMNSYRMVMLERTNEIGTMRAIGVQRNGIRHIFLFEALFIAFAGAMTGLILARLTMGVVATVDFNSESFFSFFLSKGRLNFSLSSLTVIKNLLTVSVISLFAVSFPASAAAKLEPAQALRTNY